MAGKIFAAIVIGSVETEMRIYELSARKGMKVLESIRTRIALGADAYSDQTLEPSKVKELCRVLKEFREIFESYRADAYKVCATSAFRELRSSLITRDHIEKQTGLRIHIISNSEQRFLDYKSIASGSRSFAGIIADGAAIVDMGGNSMQISVFEKDKLVTTQKIQVGRVSTWETYHSAAGSQRKYEEILRELLTHELDGFARLYQKDRPVRNLIIVDPDLLALARSRQAGDFVETKEKGTEVLALTADQFRQFYQGLSSMEPEEAAQRFSLSTGTAALVVQAMTCVSCLLERVGAQTLWLMDVSICDGLCYDYGVSARLLRQGHNFEEDIVAAARNISRRYKGSQSHGAFVERICLEIFDRTRKVHGMKSRERLLLQIAAILHNCGKYISLANVSDCAYNIIMSTEIIGLTHDERKIVANVVKYNTARFDYYNETAQNYELSREEYLLVTKLTAILRLANALDRSHMQKFEHAVLSLKDDTLLIRVETQADLSLEEITLRERAAFFEEVYNLHPQIRQKRQ